MCNLKSSPEKYGLYKGEYFCETHEGWTIRGVCPREYETADPTTEEGLARIINPWAWPTDEQVKIESVLYVTEVGEQNRLLRCSLKYEDAQRQSLKAAKRVLNVVTAE